MTDCPQPENPQKKADSPQVRRGVQISTRAVLLPSTGSRMPVEGRTVTHAESRSFPASLMLRRCRTRTAKQKSAPEVRLVPVLKP